MRDAGGRPRDCVVFVTHKWSEQIARHYRRLEREAGQVLDVFLAWQHGDGAVPTETEPDLVVRWEDTARLFPRRYDEMKGRPSVWGYIDLVWITAFLDPLLADYDRFWLVEYDVDFSGDWATFFRAAAEYRGDFLSARIRPLSAEPAFFFAPIYRQPPFADADPLIAFMPISRMSRRFLEHYCEAVRAPGWHGHFEMVVPSIARAGGFAFADIGGHDLFTPPERRGLHYDGDFSGNYSRETTHGYRPARGYRYFGDAPGRFALRERIYHPIKANSPLRTRLNDQLLPLIKRFRAFSRRLRGKVA